MQDNSLSTEIYNAIVRRRLTIQFCNKMFKWKWYKDKRIELRNNGFNENEIEDMIQMYIDEYDNSLYSGPYQKYQDLYSTPKDIKENQQTIESTFIQYIESNQLDYVKEIQTYLDLIGQFSDIRQYIMKYSVEGKFDIADAFEKVYLQK